MCKGCDLYKTISPIIDERVPEMTRHEMMVCLSNVILNCGEEPTDVILFVGHLTGMIIEMLNDDQPTKH